ATKSGGAVARRGGVRLGQRPSNEGHGPLQKRARGVARPRGVVRVLDERVPGGERHGVEVRAAAPVAVVRDEPDRRRVLRPEDEGAVGRVRVRQVLPCYGEGGGVPEEVASSRGECELYGRRGG